MGTLCCLTLSSHRISLLPSEQVCQHSQRWFVFNCQKYPMKLERVRVLGYAKFFTEEELEAHTVRMEMYCHYGVEHSATSKPKTDADIVDAVDNDDDHQPCA